MSAADDLRALSAAATPGPWEIDELEEGEDRPAVCTIDQSIDIFPVQRLAFTNMGDDVADAELIVWLRNHADALADLIDFVQEAASESRPLTAEDYEAFYACAVAGARDALAALDADR